MSDFAGSAGFGSDDLRGAEHHRDHGLPHSNPHAVSHPMPALPGFHFVEMIKPLGLDSIRMIRLELNISAAGPHGSNSVVNCSD